MTNANIVAAFIGAVLSLTIVFLTRRDHIAPLVAARWFLVAFLALFVGFFPGVIDWVGKLFGIAYPPIIPVLIGLAAAMIKILMMDIERQRLQIKVDRTIQRLAILESQVQSNNVVNAKFLTTEMKKKDKSL